MADDPKEEVQSTEVEITNNEEVTATDSDQETKEEESVEKVRACPHQLSFERVINF